MNSGEKTIWLIGAKSCKDKSEKERVNLPIKLLYFGSVLRNHNYNVIITDLTIDNSDFADIYNDDISTVVISSSSKTLPSAINAADWIKNKNKDIPIIMEGLHAIHFPDQVVNDRSFDLAFAGEGDMIIVDVVNALSSNRKDLEKIKGIVYKKGNKIINTHEEEPFSMNDLPFLDYELVDMNKYLYRSVGDFVNDNSLKKVVKLSLSRGCPYDCNFCLYKSYEYKRMSSDRAVKEVQRVLELFDPEVLFFEDANFFAKKEAVIELLNMLLEYNKYKKIKIFCTTRANYFNDNYINLNFIEKYRDIMTIWDVGAESGSARILEKTNKQISLEELNNVALLCGKANVRSGFSFMLGMPMETKKDMLKSIFLIEDLKKKSSDNTLITYQFYQPLGVNKWSKVSTEMGYTAPTRLRDWDSIFDKKVGTISPYLLPWNSSVCMLEYLMSVITYCINTNFSKVNKKSLFLFVFFNLSWNVRKFFNFYDFLIEVKILRFFLKFSIFDNRLKK